MVELTVKDRLKTLNFKYLDTMQHILANRQLDLVFNLQLSGQATLSDSGRDRIKEFNSGLSAKATQGKERFRLI